MQLTILGTGYVGIGTTTPTLGLLDVNGNIAIENGNELSSTNRELMARTL